MCGIAGIISLRGLKVENGKSRVRQMLTSMSYRGPDGSGVYESKDKTVILDKNLNLDNISNVILHLPIPLEKLKLNIV